MRAVSILSVAALLLSRFSSAASFRPAFVVATSGPWRLHSQMTQNTHRSTATQLKASSDSPPPARNYVYKDDCFGFLSFVASGGTRDVVFGSIFVVLSLTASFATAMKWFPVDPKRDTIVDRKVPGAIAALTILLSTVIPTPEGVPEPIPEAQMVQLAIGGFSIVTAFLDIRWRDRFDYPEEFRD